MLQQQINENKFVFAISKYKFYNELIWINFIPVGENLLPRRAPEF